MQAKHLTPILNVSDLEQSFAWFGKIGWGKRLQWGSPLSFGSVTSGDMEIFLCLDGQGHRQPAGAAYQERAGVWMSVWVEDVDGMHTTCVQHGVEVTRLPADEPWGVREMHIRHPDGHIFRISQSS